MQLVSNDREIASGSSPTDTSGELQIRADGRTAMIQSMYHTWDRFVARWQKFLERLMRQKDIT